MIDQRQQHIYVNRRKNQRHNQPFHRTDHHKHNLIEHRRRGCAAGCRHSQIVSRRQHLHEFHQSPDRHRQILADRLKRSHKQHKCQQIDNIKTCLPQLPIRKQAGKIRQKCTGQHKDNQLHQHPLLPRHCPGKHLDDQLDQRVRSQRFLAAHQPSQHLREGKIRILQQAVHRLLDPVQIHFRQNSRLQFLSDRSFLFTVLCRLNVRRRKAQQAEKHRQKQHRLSERHSAQHAPYSRRRMLSVPKCRPPFHARNPHTVSSRASRIGILSARMESFEKSSICPAIEEYPASLHSPAPNCPT